MDRCWQKCNCLTPNGTFGTMYLISPAIPPHFQGTIEAVYKCNNCTRQLPTFADAVTIRQQENAIALRDYLGLTWHQSFYVLRHKINDYLGTNHPMPDFLIQASANWFYTATPANWVIPFGYKLNSRFLYK